MITDVRPNAPWMPASKGWELHAANGYLLDQFLQDGSNKRTDQYGGSIENRCRFLMEVVDALAGVWGMDRIAVRIGPDSTFNGMSDSDPIALFNWLAKALSDLGLAYLHLIEPRIAGSELTHPGQGAVASERLSPIFGGKMIVAGGFEPDSAAAVIEAGTVAAVAFGRHFLSNPDLPRRIKEHLPLSPYHRDTFYTFEALGYTDYPSYSGAALAAGFA